MDVLLWCFKEEINQPQSDERDAESCELSIPHFGIWVIATIIY